MKKDFIAILSHYRQSGKTRRLLKRANDINAIIVVRSRSIISTLVELAHKLGYTNMTNRHKFITYDEFYTGDCIRGLNVDFLIDDLDSFLQYVLAHKSINIKNFAGFSMGLTPTTEYLKPYLPPNICDSSSQGNCLCDKKEHNSWITVRGFGVYGVEETRYVDANGKILGYVQPSSVFVNRDDTKWRAYIWTGEYTCIGEYINKQSALLGIVKYRKN